MVRRDGVRTLRPLRASAAAVAFLVLLAASRATTASRHSLGCPASAFSELGIDATFRNIESGKLNDLASAEIPRRC